MNDEEYIANYIKTISVKPNNTRTLFAIGMIGLTGSGKSRFAEALGSKLNLYVASNDRIRRWMNTQGLLGDSPNQELMQKIAESTSKYLYENNISHIIDNDLIKFHKTARDNANSHGANFFLLHITAPEKTIIRRIQLRQRDVAGGKSTNLSRVGIDEYYKRKQLHDELGIPSEVVMTINNDDGITDEINKVVDFLKDKNAI